MALCVKEFGDKTGLGVALQILRRSHLLDPAVIHEHDKIGHGKGFLLIMRHEDGRDAQLRLKLSQPLAKFRSDLRVQRPEGFVEEQHPGLDRQGAGERNALTLPA